MQWELRKLTKDDGRDVYDFLQNLDREENGFINGAYGMAWEDFGAWLDKCAASAEMTEIVDGWKVPQTTFWLYVDGEIAGFGKLRHFLTDVLRREGGHIGYAVAKDKRGRGYGKLLLQGLLAEARTLGIDRALATVHVNNNPSIRTALACGGQMTDTANERCYFWFDLQD